MTLDRRGVKRALPAIAMSALSLSPMTPAGAASMPAAPMAAPRVAPLVAPLAIRPPTGPMPPGFSATSPWPMWARMTWSRPPLEVTSYVVLRADGPAAPFNPLNHQPTVVQSYFDDQLPNPNVSYRYRLVANYSNGTTGYSDLSLTPAPLANPTSFQAVLTPPNTVRLHWDYMPAVKSYIVNGPGVAPNTSLPASTQSLVLQSVPAGAQSWQIVAVYAGNFADSQHPSVTTIMNRAVPPHPVPWLSKSNGPGDPASASLHLAQAGLHLGTEHAGIGSGAIPVSPAYKNVTELGLERIAGCSGPAGNPATVTCYAETRPGKLSQIAINASGANFSSWALDPTVCTDNCYPGAGTGNFAQQGFPYDIWGWPAQYDASDQATFDSEGTKYTPNVCLGCHGGHFDRTTWRVQGATLLPIDPTLVQVEGDQKAALLQIMQINMAILASNPAPAVKEYIQELYASPAGMTPGAAPFVPQGWAQEASLYLNVIKPHCAMCHLATPPPNFLTAGDLNRYRDLIYNDVCVSHVMPHAEIPYTHLHTAGGAVYLPGLLAARLGYPNC